MSLQGKINTFNVTDTPIIDKTHNPIILSMKAKSDNGTLKRGVLVAKDATGAIVAYDRAGTDPLNKLVGVLAETIDTTKDTIAPVIVHGTVVKKHLTHGTASVTNADITKLQEKTIYTL